MFKKLFVSLIFSLLIVLPVLAQESQGEIVDEPVSHVYFFHSDACPHCHDEMEFLLEISKEEKYLAVEFLEFEITKYSENLDLLKEVGQAFDADTSGVPFTVIGNEVIIGYGGVDSTGVAIRKAIDYIIDNGDPDIVGLLLNDEPVDPSLFINQDTEDIESIPAFISVPFFGEIKTANLSLPVLSIILGGVDGFNPCAMWVLVFLIGLLISMEDRRRRWILGMAFIFTSAVVYYIFMVAWLNILIFIGLLFAVRLIIGLVALAGGGYSIYDFFTNKEAECKVGDLNKKRKTIEKLKDIAKSKSLWVSLVGIIFLAFAVNLVELICSAGIPAVYTQILTMSGISALGYYAYILLYVFIFMLDDLVVFVIAMKTLEVTGMTTKYTRASRMIGGIIMLIIGVLMILKPGWLAFG